MADNKQSAPKKEDIKVKPIVVEELVSRIILYQSDEDQMLKEKLDLLTERLSDFDAAQREFALTEIVKEIQGATTTITSVPKPLKFMSESYHKLVSIYEQLPQSTYKVSSINQK